MVLNRQTIVPVKSNLTGSTASSSSATESSRLDDGPNVQVALSNDADFTYTLVDKLHKK